jgi:beta-lactamase regulating signal transducer with metallopeptidase domain
MTTLIAIALKSRLVAGLALLVLRLMKGRSAAERSTVAHMGLLALVLLALAPLVLPTWSVETPALLGSDSPTVEAPVAATTLVPTTAAAPAATNAGPALINPAPAPRLSLSATAAAMALYALPAAILLFITLLALARLIALRARADVLVDGQWLSALARAQRRMGFKHGTALLTSDDLSSPISWGLMRPVILLNSRAVEASDEAEAIIAHELAHVARLDWIKLLLARVTTALFWFNPLVWLLAREAHQLREEAADDSVLAANVADTDYAQLLVGIARHECRGLLIGAHGVAPGKSSLARRVARVLDPRSARGPVARPFALGMFAGAMLVAAPLAALTLTPAGSKAANDPAATHGKGKAYAAYYPESPTDLPSIIAKGVSTSVEATVAAVSTTQAEEAAERAAEAREDAIDRAVEAADQAREAALDHADRATKRAEKIAKAKGIGSDDIDRIIEIKATGVTADYVAAMRAAAPELRHLDATEFVGMRAVGVTPEFARSLATSGLAHVGSDELTSARAIGISGDYIRSMVNAGVRTNLDGYVQLYTVGVKPEYVRSLRKSGYRYGGVDQLVQMYTMGVTTTDLGALPPPTPPRPPRVPRERGPVVEVDPGG